MKNKILGIIGIFLASLGLFSFAAMLALPEGVFLKKIFPWVLIFGGFVSLAIVVIMTIDASNGESMKCSACGREVDALIGRVNDPETKVCVDCYIGENIKEGK